MRAAVGRGWWRVALVSLALGFGCETGAGLELQSVHLWDDSNGDGQLSPGEGAGLRIDIKNSSDAEIGETEGTLRSGSAHVYLEGGALRFPRLQPGEISPQILWNSTRVRLDEDTPAGSGLPFRLTLRDPKGGIHELDFNLDVQAVGGRLVFDACELWDDSNGDKALSPGERGGLKVVLRNRGTSRISGTHGRLISESAYLWLEETSLLYPSLAPGERSEQVFWVRSRFHLDSEAPPGTSLPFRAELLDEEGQPHAVSFTISVIASAGKLAFDSALVWDDTDGDGALGPGESGGLKIVLKNTGTAPVSATEGTLRSESRYVKVEERSLRYPGLKPKERAEQIFWPSTRLHVDPATPRGTRLPFTVTLSDAESQRHHLDFSIQVE